MSNKRRNSSSPECESPEKRQRSEPADIDPQHDGSYDEPDEVKVGERPQIHASTGMAGAFPGLGRDDDGLFYGPAADGIDYLRMVRSEAKGIPDLLVAQSGEEITIVEDDVEEEGGYWEEDAYIAIPRVEQSKNEADLPQAQTRYYEVLLAHYALVRATMRCIPPLTAIEKLTSSQPISFPSESKKARYAWGQCLKTKEPSPTQIACMDEDSIYELLRLITKKMRGLFEKDDVKATKRIGAWIWAVLGKCPDRGEMSSEEIAELRELARKAIDVRNWIVKKNRPVRHVYESSEDEEEDDAQQDANPDMPEDIEDNIQAARNRLARNAMELEGNGGSLESNGHVFPESASQDKYLEIQAAKQEKLVIIDMVLTVVSEVYGQRDLLEERLVWD